MEELEVKLEFEHEPVFSLLEIRLDHAFDNVESGQQGDRWIRISEGKEEIWIDDFCSHSLQVKVNPPHINSDLTSRVLNFLRVHFKTIEYQWPDGLLNQ